MTDDVSPVDDPKDAARLAGSMIWTDGNPVVRVGWATPFFDGAEIGVWMAPGYRQSKRALIWTMWFFAMALHHYSPLVVFAPNDRAANRVEKLGFKVCGTLPPLIDGCPVTILALTRADFETRWRDYALT